MYWFVTVCAVLLGTVSADEISKGEVAPSSSEALLATILTIYKDAALVKTRYPLSLEAGCHSYFLKGIAGTISPNTLMLTLHSNSKSASIKEYALKGSERKESGSPTQSDKILELNIHTKTADCHTQVDLLYLFKNLGWRIDYTMQFSPTYNSLDLNGWIEIVNQSGVAFPNATIQLVDSSPALNLDNIDASGVPSASLKAPFYSISGTVNLDKDSVKKINWVTAQSIQGQLHYRLFIGGDFLEDMNNKRAKPSIETWVTFVNTQKQGLGLPLPTGRATLYYRSKQNILESLGTVIIPHTNVDQELSVRLPLAAHNTGQGNNEDELRRILAVETELEQTEFKKLSDKITEANYRLSLKNKSDQPISLQVVLDLPVAECKIVKENRTHVVDSPQQISWPIDIPAQSEVDLKYRLQIDQN